MKKNYLLVEVELEGIVFFDTIGVESDSGIVSTNLIQTSLQSWDYLNVKEDLDELLPNHRYDGDTEVIRFTVSPVGKMILAEEIDFLFGRLGLSHTILDPEQHNLLEPEGRHWAKEGVKHRLGMKIKIEKKGNSYREYVEASTHEHIPTRRVAELRESLKCFCKEAGIIITPNGSEEHLSVRVTVSDTNSIRWLVDFMRLKKKAYDSDGVITFQASTSSKGKVVAFKQTGFRRRLTVFPSWEMFNTLRVDESFFIGKMLPAEIKLKGTTGFAYPIENHWVYKYPKQAVTVLL